MIKISYHKNGIEVTGHAGGVKGIDIVCAGVSAIMHTAVIAVTKIAGIQQTVEAENGHFKTKYNGRNKALDIIENTMKLGLSEIEKQYPERIKIIDLS